MSNWGILTPQIAYFNGKREAGLPKFSLEMNGENRPLVTDELVEFEK